MQAKRSGDSLGDERAERSVGDLLRDSLEKHVTRIGVCPAVAGREQQPLTECFRCKVFEVPGYRRGFAYCVVILRKWAVIGQACCVVENLSKGNVLRSWNRWKPTPKGIINTNPALLRELKKQNSDY